MGESIAQKLKGEMRQILDRSAVPLTDEEAKETIEEAVFDYSRQNSHLSVLEIKDIVDEIFHSIRGLDLLQPLINDRSITEIMVNGHKDIFIERQGKLYQHPQRFESEERLADIIQAIVGKVNRMVNDANPIVDARLSDGSRVNIVLPPVSLNGPVLTIRKFPEKPLTMEELIEKGAIDEEAAGWLQTFVRCKFNMFISGGTGSGKTTFLNALSHHIPADERIITIEDSAELQIQSIPNIVRMETRNPNTEGKGEITIRQLIRSSLRMRPNRIIVGEVRGAEALDMLQAMNTGHEGSLSTGHANSVEDMLGRLETMVLSGADLPIQVVRKQISSALDIMIHLSRRRDHSRKVTEISEVVGLKGEEIALNRLFVYSEEAGRLRRTGNRLYNSLKLEQAGVTLEERGG